MSDLEAASLLKISYPAKEVEACLRAELLHVVEAIAQEKNLQMPSGVSAQAAMSVQIDSLVTVELICAAEPILGFELKDHVVRAGGYRSIDDAIAHLMPGLEKEWQKHQTKRGKK